MMQTSFYSAPCMVRMLGLLLLCSNVVCQVLPENNDCETAILLDSFVLGSLEVTGNTRNATTDDLSFCGQNIVRSPGVWFRYDTPPAEDQIVQASTCDEDTIFDTAITVLSPPASGTDEGTPCAVLSCIDGRDNDTECGSSESHSTVSWRALAGTTYYIQVHGSSDDDTGEFVLRLTQEDPLDPPEEGDGSAAALAFRNFAWIASLTILMFSLVS